MQSKATNVQEYIQELPNDRKAAMEALRSVISKNIPKGFEEVMSYGMIGYVLPHSIYPKGYHCVPELPLPMVNIASQKNFIALYHMGIYMNAEILNWFTEEYPKHCKAKLDTGKSCIRFKKMNEIPYELIGELMKKISVKDYIRMYESILNKSDKAKKNSL